MDTALLTIEQLTCLYLKAEASATRTFDVRENYSTVFTDIFESVTSVKLDGVELTTDDYSVRQWDRRNADWYNSLVLNGRKCGKELEVTGKWVIPAELQDLIDKLDPILTEHKHSLVKSKRVEDFSYTLGDMTDIEQFVADNQAILSRYSVCDVNYVLHGGC